MLPVVMPVAASVLAVATVLRGRRIDLRNRWIWALGLAIAGFLLLTLLPLPDMLAGETRVRFFAAVREILARLNALAPDVRTSLPGGGGRLSLSFAGSVRFLFNFTSALFLFLLAAGLSARQKLRLLQCTVVFGGLIACTGILGRTVFPQEKALLWTIPTLYGHPMGPFVNRNHFALFCAVVIPAALSLTAAPTLGIRLSGKEDAGEPVDEDAGNAAWQAMALRFLFFLCLAAAAGGVLLSASRSGAVALLAAAGVTSMLWVKARPGVATAAVLIGVAVLMCVLYWPAEETRERLETLREAAETESAQSRFAMWHDTAHMWRDFPVTGIGFGAFRTVYPVYKSFPSRKSPLHCENEYVNVLAEGGVVGAGLFAILLAAYIAAAGRGLLWRRRDQRLDISAKGFPGGARLCSAADDQPAAFVRIAGGVLAAVLVHSAFEFGLRIPLNAMAVALFLGAALPSARKNLQNEIPAGGLPKRAGWTDRVWRVMLLGSTGLLAVGLLAAALCWGFSAWKMDKGQYLSRLDNAACAKALTWAPSYWLAWYETGRRALTEAQYAIKAGSGQSAERWTEAGMDCFRQAARLDSRNYLTWLTLAELEFARQNQAAAVAAAEQVLEVRPWMAPRVRHILEGSDQSLP